MLYKRETLEQVVPSNSSQQWAGGRFPADLPVSCLSLSSLEFEPDQSVMDVLSRRCVDSYLYLQLPRQDELPEQAVLSLMCQCSLTICCTR